jgi:superfamily II DNA or RNA helicase
MFSDFKEYAKNQSQYDVEKHCHPIYSGQEKITNKKVVISTWQSIYKLPKEWFSQFDVVIGDEVHLFKAKSLTGIMSKLENTKYRFGTTGTLDGTQTHKLVLEGLFGTTFSVTTTRSLMEKKQLAELKIECVVLKYDQPTCKQIKKLKYNDEIKFLVENDKRNTFIRNLAVNTKSNCLVLFQFVESHGKILFELIKEKAHRTDPNRKVFFVSGATDADTREEIRHITENERNAIIVASTGVFSTGINIRNLENIIFASPTKSRIKTLQSIGRTLRIGDHSDKATLYDIVDDLTDKTYKNFAVKHFLERVKIYNEEKFKYKLHKVNLF